MKTLKHLMLILLTALFLTACNELAPPDGVTANETAIHLSDYKGKWVVVNYWAAWCEPCLTELPELNALYHAHKDKVMVLGVSFDRLLRQDVITFAKSLNIDFPMLMTFHIGKFKIDEVPSLPVTFLISPDGKLAKTLYGPQTQDSLLKEMGLK